MIDFATLTGAARVALGFELPALFCNHDDTADDILPPPPPPMTHSGACHCSSPMNGIWKGHVALSSTGASGYGGRSPRPVPAPLCRQADQLDACRCDAGLGGQPGRPKAARPWGCAPVLSRSGEILAARISIRDQSTGLRAGASIIA